MKFSPNTKIRLNDKNPGPNKQANENEAGILNYQNDKANCIF